MTISDATRRVALAYPYTGDDGKTYQPDSEVDVPTDVAVELITAGRARAVEKPKTTTKTTTSSEG